MILPVLALLLLAGIRWRPGADLRRGLLEGAVLWGTVLVLGTEVLSLWNALGTGSLAALWGAVCTVGGVLLVRRHTGHDAGSSGLSLRSAGLADLKLGPFGEWLAGGLLLSAIVLLALALVAAPTTGDSMTYHLARVVHWAQAGSVAHYPTHIERQVYMGPGAEFAMLHLWILGGGDRFVALVQWGAMAGSVLGVSWIATLLGAEPRVQLLAAVFAGTLPIGVLEATSTQTDYVTAFWLVAFIAFGLASAAGRGREPGHGRGADLFFVGSALGLALLAKGTAYAAAAPFGVLLVWRLLRAQGAAVALVDGCAVALIALALNAGQYARNLRVYGSPLGSDSDTGVLNEAMGPALLASNLVRNGTLHMSTLLPGLNHRIERAVVRAHESVGLDPSDPRITLLGPYRIPRLAISENLAGNPLHLALLLAALVMAACMAGLRRQVGGYALALAAAGLLHVALIRWQIWGSRLQLPLFAAGSPVVALALGRAGRRPAAWLGLALLAASIPYVVQNRSKRLVGRGSTVWSVARSDQYWRGQWAPLRPELAQVAGRTRALGCNRIGVVMGPSAPEYLLQLALRAGRPGAPRLLDYRVTNRTAVLAPPADPPCVIVLRDTTATAGSSAPAPAAESIPGHREEWRGTHVSLWAERWLARRPEP